MHMSLTAHEELGIPIGMTADRRRTGWDNKHTYKYYQVVEQSIIYDDSVSVIVAQTKFLRF